MAVDTLGHLLALHVPPANAHQVGSTLPGVTLPAAKQGFGLLPRRWVVERSFGWPARLRRLARDYERLPPTLAGLHFLTFAILMLKRMLPLLLQSSSHALAKGLVLDNTLQTGGYGRPSISARLPAQCRRTRTLRHEYPDFWSQKMCRYA